MRSSALTLEALLCQRLGLPCPFWVTQSSPVALLGFCGVSLGFTGLHWTGRVREHEPILWPEFCLEVPGLQDRVGDMSRGCSRFPEVGQLSGGGLEALQQLLGKHLLLG